MNYLKHNFWQKLLFFCADPKLLEKTGKIITTAQLGDEYGLLDIDGKCEIIMTRRI